MNRRVSFSEGIWRGGGGCMTIIILLTVEPGAVLPLTE